MDWTDSRGWPATEEPSDTSIQTLRALIDTGADRTAIHPHVLSSIKSPASGTIRLRRPGSHAVFRTVDLHDVRLAFAGHDGSRTSTQWVAIQAVAVVPADPGILALIGRDMLAYCQFVYDGPKAEVVLVY